MLDCSLSNPWRDEPCGHAATDTIELVGIVDSIGGRFSVTEIVGTGSKWRRNVVVETSSFIEGDDEKRVVPLRTSSEGFVDLA